MFVCHFSSLGNLGPARPASSCPATCPCAVTMISKRSPIINATWRGEAAPFAKHRLTSLRITCCPVCFTCDSPAQHSNSSINIAQATRSAAGGSRHTQALTLAPQHSSGEKAGLAARSGPHSSWLSTGCGKKPAYPAPASSGQKATANSLAGAGTSAEQQGSTWASFWPLQLAVAKNKGKHMSLNPRRNQSVQQSHH